MPRNSIDGQRDATENREFLTHIMEPSRLFVHFNGMNMELEPTDPHYFYHRAEEELEQAQRAEHPAAVKAHYTLAGFYLDRVYGPGEDDRIAASAAESPSLL